MLSLKSEAESRLANFAKTSVNLRFAVSDCRHGLSSCALGLKSKQSDRVLKVTESKEKSRVSFPEP